MSKKFASASSYPLQWADGFPRTKRVESSRFNSTLFQALENVQNELRKFGSDSGKKLDSMVSRVRAAKSYLTHTIMTLTIPNIQNSGFKTHPALDVLSSNKGRNRMSEIEKFYIECLRLCATKEFSNNVSEQWTWSTEDMNLWQVYLDGGLTPIQAVSKHFGKNLLDCVKQARECE